MAVQAREINLGSCSFRGLAMSCAGYVLSLFVPIDRSLAHPNVDVDAALPVKVVQALRVEGGLVVDVEVSGEKGLDAQLTLRVSDGEWRGESRCGLKLIPEIVGLAGRSVESVVKVPLPDGVAKVSTMSRHVAVAKLAQDGEMSLLVSGCEDAEAAVALEIESASGERVVAVAPLRIRRAAELALAGQCAKWLSCPLRPALR
jgi:hypothetical protein